MCTPAIRRFKELFPTCRVHFYTRYSELLCGIPYIDEVSSVTSHHAGAVWLKYECPDGSKPSQKHLATLIGQSIGIDVGDVTPDCRVDVLAVERYKRRWLGRKRPYIVINRRASRWTPNKDWPDMRWDRLVEFLAPESTLIDVGLDQSLKDDLTVENFIDLRGRLALEDLVACIAAADILVSPESGPVHIAAAVGTPAIVILGGYTHPNHTRYSKNIILHTPIGCSPCWLRTPCPIGKECLLAITPEAVLESVMTIWKSIR
jgi:ADP-heptose:LPS heptosyltransferase